MKKLLMILLIFPLFAATSSIIEDTDPRPTLEQQLQLSKNELNRINSRIDEKLATFNTTEYDKQVYKSF